MVSIGVSSESEMIQYYYRMRILTSYHYNDAALNVVSVARQVGCCVLLYPY